MGGDGPGGHSPSGEK